MSRIRILCIGVGLVVIGIALAPWGRAAAEAAPVRPAEPAAKTERERALEQRLAERAAEIDHLKRENDRLKRQIRELKSRGPAVLPKLPPLTLRPPAPPAPKNAVPREFNGETYYLVPLTGGRPASNVPLTPPGR